MISGLQDIILSGILSWDSNNGETACSFVRNSLSHHGIPIPLDTRKPDPRNFKTYENLDPISEIKYIMNLIKEWLPEAFTSGGQLLPNSGLFQNYYLGMLNYADWIASDERLFPYVDHKVPDYITYSYDKAKSAVKCIGLDISDQDGKYNFDFEHIFQFDRGLNNIQQQLVKTDLDNKLWLLESETGSGKTEAAFILFARLYEAGLVDGMYFALPTRAAATQLQQRAQRFINKVFGRDVAPEVVLSVPGYLQVGDGVTGKYLHHYEVFWEDSIKDRISRWSAESSKRYTSSQIAVGTVDQIMLGAMKVKNSNMRAFALSRHLLVIDEIHASDTYMRRIIKAAAKNHLDFGGYVLLMSATLGSDFKYNSNSNDNLFDINTTISLEEAKQLPYPALTASDGNITSISQSDLKQKSVKMYKLDKDDATNQTVAKLAIEHANNDARVLIIRNTRIAAIETVQILEQYANSQETSLLFSCNDLVTACHSRYASEDRKKLDKEIENQIGKNGITNKGLIIVGTQVLEQSLDIDSDIMITDLCPVDVLLQRLGRLHRHDKKRGAAYQEPICYVITPDLINIINGDKNDQGLGFINKGTPNVYSNLLILEATKRLISDNPLWVVPKMNRELVESATHIDALKNIEHEIGDAATEHFIITVGYNLAAHREAAQTLIDTNKTFNDEQLTNGWHKRHPTRLGDSDIEVRFDPPLKGIYATDDNITSVNVPWYWIHEDDREKLEGVIMAENVSAGPNSFEFTIGDNTHLIYNKYGINKIKLI